MTAQTDNARYEVVEEIGRTRTGGVMRCIDRDLRREVAIKFIGVECDPMVKQGLVDTARIMAQLDHPCIPPVIELGLSDRWIFKVMKLATGKTLDAMLKDDTARENRKRLLAIFHEVCWTIAYANSRKVAHFNLGPADVMIDDVYSACCAEVGRVHVLGWGNSVCLQSLDGTTQVRNKGLLTPEFESPGYLAPELARGEDGDLRSDVFALGAILCHILTVEPPFPGDNAIALAANANLAGAMARLDRCRAGRRWVALARDCIQPRPEDRPADAMEVATRLRNIRSSWLTRLFG